MNREIKGSEISIFSVLPFLLKLFLEDIVVQ